MRRALPFSSFFPVLVGRFRLLPLFPNMRGTPFPLFSWRLSSFPELLLGKDDRIETVFEVCHVGGVESCTSMAGLAVEIVGPLGQGLGLSFWKSALETDEAGPAESGLLCSGLIANLAVDVYFDHLQFLLTLLQILSYIDLIVVLVLLLELF